jgi:hypothetical protein
VHPFGVGGREQTVRSAKVEPRTWFWKNWTRCSMPWNPGAPAVRQDGEGWPVAAQVGAPFH